MPQVVFDRVIVNCLIIGTTQVSWELNRHFVDPGPYTFQLQVGHVGLTDADDWQNVGAPVVDTYFTFDTTRRLYGGKVHDTHYRVELTTPIGTYYSDPQNCLGALSRRDWITAREIKRKELLRHRILTSIYGYLLKARRYGPKCPDCLDEFTEEVSQAKCTTCYGTGFEFGYFDALPAAYADTSLTSYRDALDQNIGMVNRIVQKARFIGDPQLYSYDVWIDGDSDERYYIHTISILSQIRGVPIIYEAELRLAPFGDIIYEVPLSMSSKRTKKYTGDKKEIKLWQTTEKINNLDYIEAAIQSLKRQKRTRS